MAKRERRGGHYKNNAMVRDAPEAHAFLTYFGQHATPVGVADEVQNEVYAELLAAKRAKEAADRAPKPSNLPHWFWSVYNNEDED